MIPVRRCDRPPRLFAALTFARVRAVTREYAGEAAWEYPRTVASTLRGQVPRSTAEAGSASTRNARVRAVVREYAEARGYARSSGSTRIAGRVARRDMKEGRPRGWSVLSAGAGGMLPHTPPLQPKGLLLLVLPGWCASRARKSDGTPPNRY
jgi:hypothetical protein